MFAYRVNFVFQLQCVILYIKYSASNICIAKKVLNSLPYRRQKSSNFRQGGENMSQVISVKYHYIKLGEA